MTNDQSDFTQGSILKKLVTFMMPVLGALILQAAYGAVDLLVVGRFGSTSGLSAVSTGSQVLNLVTFVVIQTAMGITVLIARYLGEKKPEQIGSVIGGSAIVFTIISVVLFVVMVGFARPISILMQAPTEAVDLTATYVRICGAGIFFVVAYNLLSAIFRGLGDSKSPLLFVLVACIINIFGDLALVAGLHMDAAGAAIATVAAQACSVVFAVILLMKKQLPFEITKKDFRLNIQCQRFLEIGLPLALQEFLTQISFLALCAFVNRLGLEASSGYGVACKIVNFAMLVPSALMQSMASFVSQNVGAGKLKRARQSMLTGIGVGLVVGCFVFALVMLKGDVLTGFFSTDEAVIQNGFAYLKGFAPETIVTAVLFSMIGYFNGNNKTVWVMTQGLIQTLLIRLPFAYIMSIQPNASLT
ncbi:MATE family efflux transporter, partial [Hominiventricola filiformis]